MEHEQGILQPGVAAAVVKMYDRYIDLQHAAGKPGMDMRNFLNQLVVRGLIAYADKLEEIESEIDDFNRTKPLPPHKSPTA